MYYIGIDLGGTNIKAGVVDEAGNIIKSAKTPTGARRPHDEIVADMAALGKKVAEEAGLSLDDIHSVGVGSPGVVDDKRGVLVFSNNVNFHNTPVCAKIESLLKRPCFIGNDANCAAWGEYEMLPEKVDDFVFITLGTGIGGGVVIEGKLRTGFNGAGYEVGHSVMQVGGIPCSCGRKGCWETLASVTALIRMTRQAISAGERGKMYELCGGNLEQVGGRTAFLAAKEGDAAAQKIVDEWICYVAEGISNMISIFQPQVLSIGGAISNEGDYLLKPVAKLVEQARYTQEIAQTELRIAALGNDAGLIGAAFLGKNRK